MKLIIRTHRTDVSISEAVYSSCERYRYSLTRSWDAKARRLLFIMLNPSKATELANDPTVERCERRARRLGYGAFRVANLFALRETSPAHLKRASHPNGPDNDAQLQTALDWTDDVLCAWGVHGSHLARDLDVFPIISASGKPPYTLGVTKDGHPRHPLYVAYATSPETWDIGTADRWLDSM